MKKKTLILTSFNKTFHYKKTEPIFLGNWCILEKEKNCSKENDYKILPYHWNNRKKLYNDYKYLNKVNEKLLNFLYTKLNKIHNLNYNKRSWQIILGPWLINITAILYDRWYTLNDALKKNNVSLINTVKFDPNLITPQSMDHFIKIIKTDLWNELLFSLILKNINKNVTKNIKIKQTVNYSYKELVYNENKLSIIQRFSHKIIGFFIKNNKSFLYKAHFNLKDYFIIIFLSKIFPTKFKESSIIRQNFCDSLRKNLFKQYLANDDFEIFLAQIIKFFIPTAYLEGFKKNNLKALRMSWPLNPKFIWTTGAYYADDIFKLYTAYHVNKSSLYIISQHGGFFGQEKFSQELDFKLQVSDFFHTWGWNRTKDKCIPLGCLKRPITKGRNKNKKIRLIISSCSRFSSSLSSMPLSSQCETYNDEQINFLKSLKPEVLEKILVRPYTHDFKWELEKRIKERFKKIKIEDIKLNYKKALQNSSLIISGWNSTTYLESIGSDIPTIIFWDKNWEFNIEATKMFKKLEDVGVFHKNYYFASKHLNEIHNNIDDWWNSLSVQKALKEFKMKYILRDKFNRNISKFLKQLNNS